MGENQKVFITNEVVNVRALESLPVESAKPLEIKQPIQTESRFAYKVFMQNFDSDNLEFYSITRGSSDMFKDALLKWLEQGWEIHFTGPITFGGGSNCLVLRRYI